MVRYRIVAHDRCPICDTDIDLSAWTALVDKDGEHMSYADHAAEVARLRSERDQWKHDACALLAINKETLTALDAANARAEAAERKLAAAVALVAKWREADYGDLTHDFFRATGMSALQCAAQLAEVVGRGEGSA